MKIIIAGSGEVGSHLAKLLSYESQEITLIDSNDEKLTFPNSQLDIRVVQGDCTSISVLNKANVTDADLFIGVTASEAVNLTACYLAKQLGAKKTIARISNPELKENENIDFSDLGISELISPEILTSKEINMAINRAEFTDPFEFDDGALITLGLSATHTSTFVGKTVVEAAEIFPETHFFPISIKRGEKTIIPRGDTVFHSGDHIVFMTEPGGAEELLKLSGQNNGIIKNVMILGGGRVGKKVAEDLSSNNFNVKIVEINKERAEELAEDLENCLIIYGDGTNSELLEEENLDQMDSFIAVTGDSEDNIMSSLIAKSKGISKTIALVDNLNYYKLSQISGIDTLINKKLLAADAISKHVHNAEVVAISQLANMDAELLEYVVNDESEVCNKTIKDLEFPRCAIIAGVIRESKGYIVLGDFKIISGDRIVVCCLKDSIQKVEKLF